MAMTIDELRASLGKVDQIVGKPTGRADQTEWTDDLAVWSLAWLMEEFGGLNEAVLFEGLIVTADNAVEMGAKLGDFFVPPAFVREVPFPKSIPLWWEAVGQVLKAGKGYDGIKPNYGVVVSAWKDLIDHHYGFRPSASGEKKFADSITHAIAQSAALMAKKRSGQHVSPEAVSKAAQTMAAKSAHSAAERAAANAAAHAAAQHAA